MGEAPGLGKPVLVLRETTERPEGVAAGTVRVVGTNPGEIARWTRRLLEDSAEHDSMAGLTQAWFESSGGGFVVTPSGVS